MKGKHALQYINFFLLSNISHLFPEDKAYKNTNLCFFESLRNIILMTMYLIRYRKEPTANLKLLRQCEHQLGSCVSQTGSRLKPKVCEESLWEPSGTSPQSGWWSWGRNGTCIFEGREERVTEWAERERKEVGRRRDPYMEFQVNISKLGFLRCRHWEINLPTIQNSV